MTPPPCGRHHCSLQILHQDDELVAVAKPSGMLVHRGWAADGATACTQTERILGRRVWPVHRLDRGTSGVLLFALRAQAAARMGALFESGMISKQYIALVRGRFPDAVEVEHPLRPLHPKTGKRQPQGTVDARPARTSFVALACTPFSGRDYSLVCAVPKTGRTHQIRRHLKHLSHPIVGDVRYGKGPINQLFRAELGLCRLALHAATIEIPTADTVLRIVAPVPPDLAEPLRMLGLTPPGKGWHAGMPTIK